METTEELSAPLVPLLESQPLDSRIDLPMRDGSARVSGGWRRCYDGISTKVRAFFTRGVAGENITTAETSPETRVEDNNDEVIEGGRSDFALTEEWFGRLDTLERRATSLRVERGSLVKEAEDHFGHFLNKFWMVTAIGITGSITVDIVSCGVGMGIAISESIVLVVTCLPIFVHAWVRILGYNVRLSLLRDRLSTLSVRVSDLKSHYVFLNIPNKASPHLEVDPPANITTHPPRSPEVVEKVDFDTRLDNLIVTIRSDLRDRGCWYNVYLVGMSILGIAYCLGLPYVLYSKVCPGKKGL